MFLTFRRHLRFLFQNYLLTGQDTGPLGMRLITPLKMQQCDQSSLTLPSLPLPNPYWQFSAQKKLCGGGGGDGGWCAKVDQAITDPFSGSSLSFTTRS